MHESITRPSSARKRGIGKRKCLRCGRVHRPLSPSVKFCGACSARMLALAASGGLWR